MKFNQILDAFQREGRILSYRWRGTSNWVGSDAGPAQHFDVIISSLVTEEDEIELESDLRAAMGRDFTRIKTQ